MPGHSHRGFFLSAQRNMQKTGPAKGWSCYAVDGTRTRTVSPPGDFKSLTLYRIICPELDNYGLFCPDITRKLRQTPGISNSYRHHSTSFDLLLLPPISPCFAMVFCNLEGCWRDEKTHPSGFDLIQQKHYICFPRC